MSNAIRDISKNYGKQKKSSLFSRFRLNVFSYGYAQIVTLCAQLVLVPFFLKYWGTDLYADWLVLTGVPTMLTLLELGVAQASTNRACMLVGANDIGGVRRSLQTALVFTLCLSSVILLLALTAGQSINWTAILGLSHIEKNQASTIILIMSAYLCINLLGGPLEGWFKTIDRTAIGAFLLANRRMADILISIIMLIIGCSALELAAVMLITQLVILVCLVFVANRLSPWRILGLAQVSWEEFLGIWKPAVAYAGFPLAQVITLHGGLQVLYQVANPSIVIAFTMARTMMRLIIQFGVVSNNALKPEISRLAGSGNFSDARQFTLRATAIVFILCTVIYFFAISIGPWIIDWWGNGRVNIDRVDMALIGIHSLLNVAWFVPASLFIAVNKHISIASIYGISSILSLGVWICFKNLISPVVGASMLLTLPELINFIIFLYRILCDKFPIDGFSQLARVK